MGDSSREDFSVEDFDTSCFEIVPLDGHTVPFGDAVHCAVDFWTDFFKKH